MDRAVLTANYALGPGIDIDGEVATPGSTPIRRRLTMSTITTA
jgi:hypothetical protein